MSVKPEAWTAADSLIWPHLAAKLIRERHAEIERLREAIEAYIRAKNSDGGEKGGFFPKPPTVAHQRRVHLAWQELNAALRREET